MRKTITFVMVCCLMFCCVLPAVSMTVDDVYRLAQKGDAEAQYTLASMYITGINAPQNNSEGLKWLRKAVAQGHVEATCMLGLAYFEGKAGLKRNYAEAAKYLSRAANQGDATAQFFLGDLYYNGRGVKRNMSQAFKLYLKAGSQGMPEAQNNVAVMTTTDME